MCEARYRKRWEDIGVPHRYREWYDDAAAPHSGLQADGNKELIERPRLLGPKGKPVPRRVHGFGFRGEMIVDD